MDFVAIDFETADHNRHSACAMGYAIVKNNVIVKKNYTLMKPPEECDFIFTYIHGITRKDVQNSPYWMSALYYLYKDICDFLPPDVPFVAHNSPFDKSVFNALFDYYELEKRVKNDFYDTLKLSRNLNNNIINHKLPTIVEHLRLSKFNHHNAMDDAVACAEIVIHLSKITESYSMDSLWDKKIDKNGFVSNISDSRKQQNNKSKVNTINLSSFNPINHPLNNTNVAITGTLNSYTRKEMKIILEHFQSTINNSVIKKTQLLIIGEDGHNTQNHEKALKYNMQDGKIEIIDEKDLLELLNYSSN